MASAAIVAYFVGSDCRRSGRLRLRLRWMLTTRKLISLRIGRIHVETKDWHGALDE